jgi:imidazolonepropionase-like amidohydrolase
MTLLIEATRIRSLGQTGRVNIPTNAQVIDATGKYLIPGLWDMHLHLTISKASALPALVANGVTGVRDLGGLLRELEDWRVRIDSGSIIGPRILRSGPVLNGREFGVHQIPVTNGSEARGAVRALYKSGVDCIKVHRAISREAYFAAIDECRKLRIPLGWTCSEHRHARGGLGRWAGFHRTHRNSPGWHLRRSEQGHLFPPGPRSIHPALRQRPL